MTDEQFAKLPKWAQQEFRLLQRQLANAQEEAAILRGDPGRDAECRGLYVRDYSLSEKEYRDLPLPLKGRTLVWKDGANVIQIHGTHVTVTQEIHDKDGNVTEWSRVKLGYLELMGSGRVSALAIKPRSSNVVLVRNADE